ncbi:MAG: hypothetical protein DRJ10_15110 [Bacteroidetes bacterium]|nr:MAG: hypothetical protein DRJ10_15110 [Bacteroidota bacterium]
MRKKDFRNSILYLIVLFLSVGINSNAQTSMILVEGGTYKMGRDASKDKTKAMEFNDELPRHEVKLNSFYIGKYEVTVKEYKTYVAAKGKKMPQQPSAKWFEGHPDTKIYYPLSKTQWWGWKDGHPMQNVSWYDAVEYCNWLSTKEGLQKCYKINGAQTTCDFSKNGYRLPTEAEWEYAARGGQKSKGYIYAGSNNPSEVAWYDETTSLKSPFKVGTKKPNELGIYDMSGNVWEWCWDFYAGNYYSYSPKENPKGAAATIYRVTRGSSWHYRDALARVSDRDGPIPGFTSFNHGFRVVKNK